jgi:hypothetical protein
MCHVTNSDPPDCIININTSISSPVSSAHYLGMSSFAALKEDRDARQRSLASFPGGTAIKSGMTAAGGSLKQQQQASGQNPQDVNGETPQSTTDVQDSPITTQNPVTLIPNATAGPSTLTPSVRTSTVVDPSSLPPYDDFPDTLEVRQSPISGRGLYAKPGNNIRKGGLYYQYVACIRIASSDYSPFK